ncbi:RNA-binding protein [Elizabethkingia anophelis]|jgi:RNA recognition motif-containing protein|uniref:RNA recognition motif-containing protein n=8 Tax=Elizabethkingia TaxID=308865 RepID=A0AAP1BTH1_ELIMR|nr:MULTISPECIES: RNA-binding protein [Elizabethkingia]MDR2228213.1 RNA-binding protein [Flavobacteriaceae bacterium]AIL46369.1 RNA-binding protein [Elizabethkingia anophelis NUHP1]AJW61616.1 RNA recognition motif protein [Elizabethkingia miricola]AKH94899.1 RNA-binding protein [Elizabethkingia anophelis FMS-007]AMR41087.1 RNA-binding protein [Elizabethkingia anophelis]
MNIFISNINYSVKESQLEELFASYGAIQSAKIIMDRETGRSRGFGFVEMPNNDEANTAIESLNGALFQGKNLNVSEARPKEEKPRRSFNNNRY